MDQLHYMTYDINAMRRQALMVYAAETGDVPYPGDERSMMLQAVLTVMCNVYADVDARLRMDDPENAVRGYIDEYAEKLDTPVKSEPIERREGEKDSDFRTRVLEYQQKGITYGTAARYEQAALAMYPDDILDAHCYARNYEEGSYETVLLIPDSAKVDAITGVVYQAFRNVRQKAPLCGDMMTVAAVGNTYTLHVTAYISGNTDYDASLSEMTAAVNAWRGWQNDHIYRDFTPEKLVGMLYAEGAYRVNVTSGTYNGQPNTGHKTVSHYGYCTGTVVLTIVQNRQ